MATEKRGLKFSVASHRYWLDGQPVPGVTTILGVLAKPALIKWSAGEVAAYVADNREAVETLYTLGRDAMVGALKQTPWQKRDDAGKRGNILHDIAEQLLRGEEVAVDDEHVAVIESALAFMEDWHIDPILIEAGCASRQHRWAGTLDLIADYTTPDGQTGTAIFDWKSGKRIYAEAVFQLNAYAHAEFSGLDGNEAPMPKTDAAFGVHIRPDGYDVLPLQFGPHIYDEFLTIRQAFAINKRAEGDWRTPGTGYVGRAYQPLPEGISA